MKIKRVTIEVREAVLSSETITLPARKTYIITTAKQQQNFTDLPIKDQIAEIRKSGKRKVISLYKKNTIEHPEVIKEMIKRNDRLIDYISNPKAEHIALVLEKNPKALTKLPVRKRTEDLVLKALLPSRKLLSGPKDLKIKHVINNITQIGSDTPFTTKIIRCLVNICRGITPSDLRKLKRVFDKQRRELPEELLKRIAAYSNKDQKEKRR
jgi:hypothetical protein